MKKGIFKKLDKRAALTTQQIVILIILITSFAIVLFFLFRLNLQESADKEICRNSVVLKGNAVVPKETLPLNCKTSYVCVTEDGSCEDLPYYDYRITVDTKEDLYSALAEEMADCWWMFGEGKVNYVSDDFFSSLYCSICSQLTFDNSVQEKISSFKEGKVDKDEFYQYLSIEKMPGKQITYSQYLFGTTKVGELLVPPADSFGEISLDETYAVMMGAYSEVSGLGWAAAGAGTLLVGSLVFAIMATPVGWVSGAIIVGVATTAGGVGGSYVASEVKGLSGLSYLSPTIVKFPSEEYEALGCEDVETLG